VSSIYSRAGPRAPLAGVHKRENSGSGHITAEPDLLRRDRLLLSDRSRAGQLFGRLMLEAKNPTNPAIDRRLPVPSCKVRADSFWPR